MVVRKKLITIRHKKIKNLVLICLAIDQLNILQDFFEIKLHTILSFSSEFIYRIYIPLVLGIA